jgi:hypothetical protein
MKVLKNSSALLLFIILNSCSTSPEIKVPDAIGDVSRVRLVSGAEAVKAINQLHGTEVAGIQNIIAYYGSDEEDILYIASYESLKNAVDDFNKMIQKMSESQDSPFYHLMPLSSYDDNVYMTIGMGAIHYIYISGKNLLWLHTMQSFGMELPENLLALYPVQGPEKND